MEKIDLTKTDKPYYSATLQPELRNIGPARYISISGTGDPSSNTFKNDIQALYAVAYAIKFMCKTDGNDFTVPKLEGLWGYDEEKYAHISMMEAQTAVPRNEWSYRLLIRMPDFVRQKQISSAIRQVIVKKKIQHAEKVSPYKLREGKVLQILHVGPFNTEHHSLAKMLVFIDAHKLKKNGAHHEIYLSDFNKTAPDKLKTILREPVK